MKITFDQSPISFIKDVCLTKHAVDSRDWARTIWQTEMTVSVGKIRVHVAMIIGVVCMTIDKEIEIRADRKPKALWIGNWVLNSLQPKGTHQKKSVDDRVYDTNGTAE